MRFDILKNSIRKRNVISNEKNDYKDMGNFIKKSRKELNITQEELCDGICSISYLSKIENNQIVPNEFYVREIMEKLNVDELVLTNSLKEKDYVFRIITAFFYMDHTEIEKIYQEIKNIEHNTLINLCKFGHAVYFENDEAVDYMMMLEHLLNNMSDLEVGMYLYFSAKYFMNQQHYKTSLDVIKLTKDVKIHEDFLNGLIHELSYYVKQKLLIKNASNEDYNNALTIFTSNHNTKKIIKMALVKVEFLIKENPRYSLEILNSIQIHVLDDETKDYYCYLKAKIMKECGRNNECIMYLRDIKEDSSYYFKKMVLLLEVCQLEEDDEMAKEIENILDMFSPNKKDMTEKVYYHYLKQIEEPDKKEFLRDIAIPFSIKSENYHLLLFYINDLIQICEKNSRYKEALTYYNKYRRELEKIKKVMY